MPRLDETTEFAHVPLKQIKVRPDRGRKEFTRIQEMADSIKENGLIHPLFVEKMNDDGIYYLVAGERRYRGAILAGRVTVPVTFRDEVTDVQLKIFELEENVCRKDLSALEEAEMMRQIDEARREESPNWRQDDTAQLVNQSPGHVSLQIKVAKELQTRPELKEKVKGMDVRTVSKLIERTKQVEKMERLKDQGKLEVTSDLRFGSCLDLIKDIPDKSVDLVITDPPYGADKYNELREGGYSPGASLMSDTHNQDLKTVLQLMQDLTKELMRVMKDGAHCYVWVPQQYLAYFIEAMHPLEFQYPPLYWDRGRCTQPGFGYNYMNRMEAVVYFHKPPKTKKLVTNMPNIFTCPEPSRTDRQFHTEKPQEILETFVKQSSVIGDTVLDCFAGSASTLIAARTHGRKAIGFEVDEDTYKRAQLRLLGKLQEAPA